MASIVAGAVILSWPGEQVVATAWPAIAVLGACAAWAIDNNLTRKVSLNDASYVAMAKGLAAGGTNLALALAGGASWPSMGTVGAAALLGFLSYGASLVLSRRTGQRATARGRPSDGAGRVGRAWCAP